MAQYFNDFSGYADGAFNDAEWVLLTPITVIPTIVDGSWESAGKILKLSSDTYPATTYFLHWDVVSGDANRTTWELYLRMKMLGGGASSLRFRAFGRGTFSGTAATNYIGVQIESTGTITTRQVLSGVFNGYNTIASAIGTYTTNDIVNFVVGYNGTNVYMRSWDDGGSDDGINDYTYAYSASQPAGAIGINFYSSTDHNVEIDLWGVGTGGDPAPQAALTSNPTISSTTTLQSGEAFTITGTTFEGAPGTNGRVILSPTDAAGAGTGPDDVDAVVQTVNTWTTTSLVINSAVLPAGTNPGDTLYLFVRNDSEDESAGFAVQVAEVTIDTGGGSWPGVGEGKGKGRGKSSGISAVTGGGISTVGQTVGS